MTKITTRSIELVRVPVNPAMAFAHAIQQAHDQTMAQARREALSKMRGKLGSISVAICGTTFAMVMAIGIFYLALKEFFEATSTPAKGLSGVSIVGSFGTAIAGAYLTSQYSKEFFWQYDTYQKLKARQ